jgi:HTH-type transcriptional regulator, sugar sensing transcriptional regulator
LSESLIDKLKELGFNTYEAKVYLALLKHHPATGYEISKESGVPQARAYDTLKALESSNVVVAIGGKPVTYMPVRPDELLDRWEKSFNHSIKYLREALPSLADEKVEPVINMRGEESIFKHALEMIQNAKHSIFIELWKVDAERLCHPLQEAKKRGIDVWVVGYDDCTLEGIEVYQHSDVELMDGRWLIISVDDLEGMVSTVAVGDRPPQAVVTRNPGIVLIIKELIVHDIFLIDVERNLRPEIERLYGKNMLMRRRKILGPGVEVGMH